METPQRIWVDSLYDIDGSWCGECSPKSRNADNVEYVRVDVVDDLAKVISETAHILDIGVKIEPGSNVHDTLKDAIAAYKDKLKDVA